MKLKAFSKANSGNICSLFRGGCLGVAWGLRGG